MTDAKVALVTGAGSGIGEACAKLLASRGVRVVVHDLDLDKADRVCGAITAEGGTALSFLGDVSDPASCTAAVESAVDAFGGLHIAVNNAGIGGPPAPTGEYPIDGWRQVMNVNLDGVFYCMRAEIPAMLASGGGSIVNMASILGSVGFATAPAYVAAKHGVVGLTRTAALEYATQGIRVNAVGPGFIKTPLLESAGEEILSGISQAHPNKRLGLPSEVAELVAFLASDAASLITGSYYTIDGGYTAQ